jgi:RecA-family ATPase
VIGQSHQIFEVGITSCLRTIANAPKENKRVVFGMMAREAIGYARKGGIELPDIIDRLRDTALSTGLVDEHGEDEVQRDLAAAMITEQVHVAPVERPVESPLPVVTADTLHGRPVPLRRMLLDCSTLIPARTVTLLTGDGGTGKSLVALQLAAAVAMRVHWLGLPVAEPGPVLYLSAEDELDEVHRRLVDIVKHHDKNLTDLADLHILPLAGEDAILAAPAARSNVIEATALWRKIIAYVEHIRPRVVVFDTLADLFAGDENQRAQARQFIGLLRGLAIRHDTTVVVLAHPSLSGLANGTGSSGSTGWSNSVRSRVYLSRVFDNDKAEPDVDLRVLRTTKTNYGRVGDEIRVRWSQGVFVAEQGTPTGALDRLAADQMAEQVFIDCLRLTLAQGRHVSSLKCSTYAPAMFASMPQAKGFTAKVLATAMERLFAANKIKVDTKGPPSKQRRFLTLSEGDE